jgi:GNAT superfamily N-acetyltransferase
MRHVLLDDHEEARELWADFQVLSDTADIWPGDDHTYWRMQHDGKDVGLCSAVHRADKGYVYLSYAVFDPRLRGAGWQRQSIRHRLRWAKRQGAIYATTYTTLTNYPSIHNLLKCGFRFAEKPVGGYWIEGPVHYFERQL